MVYFDEENLNLWSSEHSNYEKNKGMNVNGIRFYLFCCIQK